MVANQRLKLLVIVGTLEHAGTPMHVYELVSRLDRRRFDVEVCSLRPEEGLATDIRALGIPLHVIRLPIIYRPGFPVALARLWSLIRRGRYDVVHTFLFAADVFGALMARLAGAGRVITSRRMEATFDAPRRVRAYRWSSRFADRIMTPSESARRACMTAEGFGPEKVVSVYNGIDINRVREAPAAVDFPEGPGPWLGTVSHLNPIKGHKTLVAALPSVREAYPTAQVVIAGEGPTRQDLLEQAQRLGVSDAVHLLGARSDAPSLLRRMDLFVLPSNSEGMSNALLEAMASELPVVATAVGGNPEVLRDGVSGRLVPAGDPVAMAGACCDLLSDPQAAAAMGRRARAIVEERFTVERMAADMGEFYESLVRVPASHGGEGVPAREAP